MDGPSVNWHFYDEVVKNRDEAASAYKYWYLWTPYNTWFI